MRIEKCGSELARESHHSRAPQGDLLREQARAHGGPITLTLQFKLTAPSKLDWAGRPAMRVVQALYWLRDGLKGGAQVDQDAI